MCTLEFDDPAEFRDHLGDAHGLYDDDGTETGFGEFAIPVIPAPRAPALPELAPPRRSQEPPSRGRPIDLVLVVVLLLGVLGAMIAFTGRGSDEGDTEAAAGGTARTGSLHGQQPSDAASVSPSSPGGSGGGDGPSSPAADPATTAHAASPSDTSPPAPGAAPSGATGSSSTPGPTPTTTAAPSDVITPAASGARVDSCKGVRNERHVTYSWSFMGGAGWEPLAAYTALGGSRYQHTVVVQRGKDVAISTVYVTDSNGGRHGVSLEPTLSTASC